MSTIEQDRVNNYLKQIGNEYNKASKKFAKFNSAHEGYAVIKEELDELWDEIKKQEHNPTEMHEEAVQVGAMALRFLMDVIPAMYLTLNDKEKK